MLLAFQWDLARQVERLDWLLAQLPRYADWGYRELYLHLEDAVEYPSLPGVARRDAYSQRQMQRLVEAAAQVGIGVVPIVNLLGHTQYLVKVPALRDLNELRAQGGGPMERGQICPVHPRTLEVADQLLRDVASFCTAGKVHVGLDESFQLGRHPLSRRDIARHGLAGHFARYVQRLHGLVEARGLQMGLWADMLYFLPGAIPLLPRGIAAYDWYYYPFRRHPRVELFNFAERDLGPALRARGIEYWGCPMNGAFRHEPLPFFGDRLANIRAWWQRCRRTGAAGMLITSWEPNRLAQELTTAVDAAAASLWLEPRRTGDVPMLARGFERVFGLRDGTAAARAALGADRHPFAGYARWEINDRWDAAAGDPEGFEREEAQLLALDKPSGALPRPLALSLVFRGYLALRDATVRRLARGVREIRGELAAANANARSPEVSPQKGARSPGAASTVSRAPLGAMATSSETSGPLRLLAANPDRVASEIGLATGRIRRLIARLRRDTAELEREFGAAEAAARRMRLSTRARRPQGPNELLVRKDAARLREWRRWLDRVAREPGHAWTASPVFGAWQLTFVVRNFAPALQKVVVEERQADGSWQDLHGRFTIEFQAVAANPRADIRRAFSLPIASPESRLRIAARGVGQVKLGCPTLTDGVRTLAARGWPRSQWKTVGRPAPQRGLPALDWRKNEGQVAVVWARSV